MIQRRSFKPTFRAERELLTRGHQWVAGVDEVGRGPLAGPVVVCAVRFLKQQSIKGLSDSKQLTEKKRNSLREFLVQKGCIEWSLCEVGVEEIDSLNVHQAIRVGMERALSQLKTQPDYVLVDGRSFRKFAYPHHGIIKGDQLCCSITAASIIAKVHRDDLMRQWHLKFPQYGFDQHKGYGTAFHLRALKEHGPCPLHRRTFAPVREVLSK